MRRGCSGPSDGIHGVCLWLGLLFRSRTVRTVCMFPLATKLKQRLGAGAIWISSLLSIPRRIFAPARLEMRVLVGTIPFFVARQDKATLWLLVGMSSASRGEDGLKRRPSVRDCIASRACPHMYARMT